jgi:hypothetical protein
MIAITICATEKFSYALGLQARRVQAAMSGFNEPKNNGHIILVGDGSPPLKKTVALYKKLMPEWNVHHIEMEGIDDKKPIAYREQAQIYIAQMRTAAFNLATQLGVDFCWSLDSDVLPPENAYRCMLNALKMDDVTDTGQHGYYSVATCPYPNLQFIGGRGTEEQPILPDFYEDERSVPQDILDRIAAGRKRLSELKQPDTPEKGLEWDSILRQLQELDQKVRECPPKGNVFEMNSKGWRARGWFEAAYPGIGKGSIVPIDWCGFGCNLLNKKALLLCQFDGYAGQGTEDLYIVWHRWKQADLRICAIPHCLCDHVKNNPGHKKGENSQRVIVQCYHETHWPMIGHIRTRFRPFYRHEAGEVWDEKNDGKFIPAPGEPKPSPMPIASPPMTPAPSPDIQLPLMDLGIVDKR